MKHIKLPVDFDPTMFIEAEPPLASIYLRTHRHSPENQQDPIRFRQLLTQIRQSLEKGYDKRRAASLLLQLEALADDPGRSLWRRSLKDGLAVLADKKNIRIYLTDYPVDSFAVVADSFHIKPLIRNFQYGAHYYLLALSMDRLKLYCGDFQDLEELSFPDGVKTRFDELYDDLDKPSSVSTGSFGGAETLYYGYGSKNDTTDKNIEKYFRHVDDIVRRHFVDEHPLPLILTSLKQHQPIFRSISSIPTLLEKGIEKPAESMNDEELLQAATTIICSLQETTIQELLEKYDLAQSKEQGSSDLSTIARALAEEKVATLFVQEEKFIPGRFNAQTGAISYKNIDDPRINDLTDDFAQATYLQGGEVYVLNQEMMPSDTGIAAIFRY